MAKSLAYLISGNKRDTLLNCQVVFDCRLLLSPLLYTERELKLDVTRSPREMPIPTLMNIFSLYRKGNLQNCTYSGKFMLIDGRVTVPFNIPKSEYAMLLKIVMLVLDFCQISMIKKRNRYLFYVRGQFSLFIK